MKINGVYLSYDIYNKEQMKAVQDGSESVAKAYQAVRGSDELSEAEKENLISEVYAFFADIFGDDKAIEVLGENANLTECVCASADFMAQSNEIVSRVKNLSAITANRQTRRAAVHKRK